MSSQQHPALSIDTRPWNRVNTFESITSGMTGGTRKAVASLSQAARDAINIDLPLGAWAAAAEASGKAPTLGDIRKGLFVEAGWASRSFEPSGDSFGLHATAVEQIGSEEGVKLTTLHDHASMDNSEDSETPMKNPNAGQVHYDYLLAPKISWAEATLIWLRVFWKWFLTPFGFLVTIYALNVVAWGGMLFLLLCNAAPEMCWAHDDQEGWIRDCNHLYSSRRIWLEIDSQILNALFCVTGFGLVPWRFRDLYYLLRWRLLSERKYGRQQKLYGLRTLGGIYNEWFRLPGSDTLGNMSLSEYNAMTLSNRCSGLTKYEVNLPSVKADALDPRVPWKLYKSPPPPSTGERAPPTALWKLDFFVWCNVCNTFLQACLCGFMWGMSRFNRPSWSTGLFIGLACFVAGVGGIMSFLEGKKIKRVEGVPAVSSSCGGDAQSEVRMC